MNLIVKVGRDSGRCLADRRIVIAAARITSEGTAPDSADDHDDHDNIKIRNYVIVPTTRGADVSYVYTYEAFFEKNNTI